MKVIQDPCQKITERFFLKKIRVIFIYCLKTYKYWRSQKIYNLSTHLYDQIYFDRLVQFHPSMRSSYTGQAILVRKVNIQMYSMYVLLADKVSCPMTQHFDSGDSQISNPSIPCLTLYELSHCAS